MGRDALVGGVFRVVSDHRSPEGRRVSAYMRGLIEPFTPKPWPFAARAEGNGHAAPAKPPAAVREQARTAGRLLLEEEALVAQLRLPHKSRMARRLERRLLGVRAMRIKIEKLLADAAKRKRY
jgi:hypothetical protein